MSTVAVPKFTLATAVASPAGTVTTPYPTGYVQADFTGVNASGTAYLLLNDNDRYTEVADQFDISYGASVATITNKTGYSWPIGTTVNVGFGRAAIVTYDGPVAAAIATPTSDSVGVKVAIDAIRAALTAAGITA